MEKMRLGRTGLSISRSGFGAIPIQRISFAESRQLLLKAYEGGIDFYDTARGYTDSETKIGAAFSGIRSKVVIATKTPSQDYDGVRRDLETSLRNLETDYLDIYQLHNPPRLPDPNDPKGSYRALREAKEQGKIRFIGISNHRLDVARQAVASGLYDTLQFPLCYLSAAADLEIIRECRDADVGLIAMKALSGGLITQAAAAFAFLRQYDNVVPIWGIERTAQLEEFLTLERNPPVLDQAMLQTIARDRTELSGAFCRACGYCLPCPAGIPIPMAARMSLLLRRMPYQQFLAQDWQKQMGLIESCRDCGHCKSHCPYGLDTPAILKDMLADYRQFVTAHSE